MRVTTHLPTTRTGRGATLAGVAAGYWVDQRLGTQPLFVLVGFLAGAGLGAFAIHRLVTRFLKRLD